MVSSTEIRVQGLPTVHDMIGTGAPLVLLHGWGANRMAVMPLAQRLADNGFQTYAPDLPGFGDSAPPPVVWTVFDYVTWVTAYLDSLQLKRVHLFGHSFGGRLGLVLGADYAHRVNKLVLANSAGIRPRLPLAVRARTAVYKRTRRAMEALGLGQVADRLSQSYTTRYGSVDFNATSGVMRSTFVNVIQQDLLSYAARVHCPTLLFWGDADKDTPLWMGQTLQKMIPDAGLIVHQGAGHYSYLDRLADTARIMTHFLQN